MTSEKSPEIKLVEEFFQLISSDQFDTAVDLLAEDVFYHNIPLPEMQGRENVRGFHKNFGVGSTIKVDWKVEFIAQDGNTVLTERMDIFVHKNGSKIVLPTMGSMVVEHGMITQWRDYFDLKSFETQAAAFFA